MSEEWRYEPTMNNCLRCHKEPYETEPSHWHYCNDCMKLCDVCLEQKVLWAFDFDFKSAEYKRWKSENCYGFMNRDGHKDTCASCERAQLDSLKLRPSQATLVFNEPKGVTSAQLQLMLDALQRKPGATEPPDSTVNAE